jgi:hypothetical protein
MSFSEKIDGTGDHQLSKISQAQKYNCGMF